MMEMRRLLLIALLALSGCYLSFRKDFRGGAQPTTPTERAGGHAAPVVITIDAGGATLCGPEDTDPQHTCP